MSWRVTWDGQEYDADDFTLADLGRIEKDSGQPWSTANVYRDSLVAKAFLGTAMRKSGMTDREAAAELEKVTMRVLREAFDWRTDDPAAEAEGGHEEVDPSDPPAPSTTPGSSHTSSAGGSRRAKGSSSA